MDLTTLTIDFLKTLSNIFGSYGLGIIALTVIIRLAMWPLGVSQQRSMRTMQQLQPKMKSSQDRYKNNPQRMQQKMMDFYKENKFNPMAGCLPLLIQMPIFILLYSSLMSPQFISMAGQSDFLFINRLDAGMNLGSDVTTYYAFQINMAEQDLTQKQLDTKNPYNTRHSSMAGKLPVGPICNSSKSSLDAALSPKETDAFYFVADKNGKVYFTKNYSEHTKIIKELKANDLWYVYE